MIRNFKMKKGTTWLWPLVVLAIAFGAFWLKPWQTNPTETISVTALGKTEVTPDIAIVNATIESKNPNLDAARRENEAKVTSIVSELKKLGVEEKDIQTKHISGGPGYEPVTPEIQVFPVPRYPNTNQFMTTIEVKIRNF